jgi:excisionase family DNA binding protein
MSRKTYSVAEAAKLVGVGKATMYHAIRTGQVYALKIGRKPRIVVPRCVIEGMLSGDVRPRREECEHA